MRKLLVVGCVSYDVLHLDQNGERTTYETIGGAGLYTALAARCIGADVSLYAPMPDPVPELFAKVATLIDWRGPRVNPERLPRLEIVHHGGGKATLLNAAWGAEDLLTVQNLDECFSLTDGHHRTFSYVHIAALSSAAKQLGFLSFLEGLAQKPAISVGTYARVAYGETQSVQELVERSDIAFMNENEAKPIFGTRSRVPVDDKIFCVTDGENGATLYKSQRKVVIAGVPAKELDPTGAGDSFCGATLAGLIRGQSIEEAASLAAALATKEIEAPGPQALLGWEADT